MASRLQKAAFAVLFTLASLAEDARAALGSGDWQTRQRLDEADAELADIAAAVLVTDFAWNKGSVQTD